MLFFAIFTSLLLAQVTASPSPTASATPNPCFHDARITKPVQPDVDSLWGQDFRNVPLATTTLVTVGADGSVKKVSVSKTSGSIDFDLAVERAAKRSKYSPKVVSCQPVEATVPFLGTFTPIPLP
jgi:TonB family protein